MKIIEPYTKNVAGFALLCLVSWSAQAAADKPCQGKDCPLVKAAKLPPPPVEAKANKDTRSVKLAGDGSVRKQAATGDGSVSKQAAAGDGSVRKAVPGDGSVRPGTAEAQKVAPLKKTLTPPVPAGK